MAENFQVIRDNVQKMVNAGAPPAHINGYLKQKGLTPEQFRAGLAGPQAPVPGAAEAEYLRSYGSRPDGSPAYPSDDLANVSRPDTLRENPSDPLTRTVGALGNYVDTAMLGGADETLAGVHALGAMVPGGRSPGQAFQQELSRLEQARRDFDAQNTLEGKVGTGAGIALNPLNLVGGEFIAAAPTVAARAGRAAGLGAGIGGAAGALGTEGDIGDRSLGAGIGATGGAVLGGTAQPGMELLGFGGRKGTEAARAIINTLRNQAQAKANPTTQANKIIARALMQDQSYSFPMRPALPGEGNVNLAGENLVGLGRQTTVAQGEGRTIARNFFDEQTAGQSDRAADALGGLSNQGYYGTLETLDAGRRTAARPNYEAWYATPSVDHWTPEISELMRRPSMRGAYARAQRVAAEEGRSPTELGLDFNEAGDPVFLAGADANGQVPSSQTMDYIKRGLDDVMQAQPRDPATGRIIMNEETRAIDRTRRELVGIIRQNPAAAAALDSWAGPSHSIEVMDLGRQIFRKSGDPADSIRRFQQLSPADQDYARIGYMRDAVNAAGNVTDGGSVYNRLYGTPNKRALAEVMFPDRRSFDRFANQMLAERKMTAANRTITGGSPTSRIDADKAAMSDIENDLGLIDALKSGSITRLIGEAAQRGKNFQQGMTPEVAAVVARALFNRDPRALSGAQNVRVPAPLAAIMAQWLRNTPVAPLIGQGAGFGGAAIATPERVGSR